MKSVGHGGSVLLWCECSDSPSLTQRQKETGKQVAKLETGAVFAQSGRERLHALCQKIGKESDRSMNEDHKGRDRNG